MAANRLIARRPNTRVTVVNPRANFVERVRLHQVAAGTGSGIKPLARMLAEGVTLRIGAAEEVGDSGLAVRNPDGSTEQVTFDRLVLAAGNAADVPSGTHGIATLEAAEQARDAIAAVSSGGSVAVVGAGLTGVEAAAEIARARPDLGVELIGASEPCADFGDRGRNGVRSGLERAGVRVVDGSVVSVQGDRITLADDSTRSADVVIWAVASGPAAPIGGVSLDGSGRIRVDEYLRSVDDPRVMAVGDIAGVPDARPSCQAALPEGAYAAELLAAEGLEAGRVRPFAMRFVARNVSLGRSDGVIQATDRADRPVRWAIGGRPAAAIKETFCKGTVQALRFARFYPA